MVVFGFSVTQNGFFNVFSKLLNPDFSISGLDPAARDCG